MKTKSSLLLSSVLFIALVVAMLGMPTPVHAAPRVGSVSVGTQSPNPVNRGSSATYTITINRGTGGGSAGNFTATLSITGLPAGVTASFSPNPVSFSNTNTVRTATLILTASGTTPAGSTAFTVRAERNGSDFATGGGTLVVAVPDTTPPVITYSLTGTTGSNGWYTSNVTVTWNVSDPQSDITSSTGCTPPSSSITLSTETAGTTLTCSATSAGGTSSVTTSTIKIDKTAPTSVVLTPSGTLGLNGWYTGNVTITTSSTEILSTPVTCTTVQSQITDTTGTIFNGSCTNAAGLSTAAAPIAIKRDATAPTSISVSPDRAPDVGGYYNHSFNLTWSGTDATSGIASCTIANYSGPDGSGLSINGTCTDNAGNTSAPVASSPFNYDGTAPIITYTGRTAPNANGWNSTNVTVNWSCTNASVATVSQTLTSEGTGQSATGTCTDNAGNTASDTQTGINIDKTGPTAILTPSGTLGNNGWYTGTVTITTIGNDISTPVTCTTDQFQNADTTGTIFNGSCTNAAGLSTNAAPITIKRDSTAPTGVSGGPNRVADSNGWYNHAVGIVFSGVDAVSGIASCNTVNYTGPSGSGLTVNGTCTDLAGNTSAPVVSSTFDYDVTPPTVTGSTPDRVPDTGSWYNHTVTFIYAGTDALSGLASCDVINYNGPDGSGITVNGACTDLAGNTSSPSASIAFDFDATAPTGISGAPNRAPDFNGWYNHAVDIIFSGIDTTSGIAACDTITYSGPDGSGIHVNGTCTDLAGNIGTPVASSAFNYNSTGPTATLSVTAGILGSNGWYISNVTISTSGSDSTGRPVTCTADQFQTNDTAGTIFNGSCTNAAGLTTNATPLTIKLDTTAPSVVATIGRLPDFNGWYNHTVDIVFNGTDATSGIDACDPTVLYTGPDSTAVSVSGACTDAAGNSANASANFKYDGTGPTAFITPSGTLGTNGWYIGNVTIATSGSDSIGGPVTCTADQNQITDTTGVVFNGSCTNAAGLTTNAAPLTIKRDTTSPVIAFLNRTTPNAYGWNNTSVTVNWSCTDQTSGPVSPIVSQVIISEGTGQSTSGTCTDDAGNTSAPGSVNNINIDTTAPVISYVGRSPEPDGSGWNYSPVTVTWNCADGLSGVINSPVTVTIATEGKGQSATGTCEDKAGNMISNTQNDINITSVNVPPSSPTPAPVIPETGAQPIPTQPPAPDTQQPVEPTEVPTQVEPAAGEPEAMEVPVTGGDIAPSSNVNSFLLYGGIGVAGLGFAFWLLFLLAKKRRKQE